MAKKTIIIIILSLIIAEISGAYVRIGEYERRPNVKDCDEQLTCRSCLKFSCYWYTISSYLGERYICFPAHMTPPIPGLIETAVINEKNCSRIHDEITVVTTTPIPVAASTPHPELVEKSGTAIYAIVIAALTITLLATIATYIVCRRRLIRITSSTTPNFGGDLPLRTLG